MSLLNLLGGIVPLLIGIVFLISSWQLPFGQLVSPGPGLWPAILSVVLIIVSFLLLITGYKKENYKKFSPEVKKVLYGIISIALFILLFETLGLEICCLLLLIYWIRFLGKESWKTAIMYSGTITISVYVVFVILLEIPIPTILGVY